MSSTSLNNGVDGFIGNESGVRIFSDCVTVANSGSVGSAFFHRYAFVASDHVTQLKREGLDKYAYLFMLPIISRLSEKYSFNREINGERIKRVDCMSSFMKDVERDILDTTLKMFKDVVLMYIQMSVMDGLEATRLIRTFNAYIPIIAVTANAFESDRVAVLQAGCSYFLSKPIEKSKLIKVIEEVTAE